MTDDEGVVGAPAPGLSGCFALRQPHRRSIEVALLVGASAAYFGWDLPAREVSLLESQDLGIAHDLFKTYALSPDHSPLHFVFLRAWESLAPHSVALLRAPSVAFAALAVVVVFGLAQKTAGRAAGWLAAGFFATNPQVVDAARSLRLYALGTLLAALCLSSADVYRRTRGRRGRLGFAATSVFAIYNHLFAWLLVGPVAAALAYRVLRGERGRRDVRRLARSGVVAAIVLVPQLVHIVVALGFTRERHALYRGLSSGASSFFVATGRALFLGDSEHAVALGSPALLAPLGLLALGVVALRGRRLDVAVVFLPALVATWLLSFSNPIEPRYLNLLTPAIAVLMGVGAAHLGRPIARVLVGAPVVFLSVFATYQAYAGARTDWYEGAARLSSIRQPGDVVAVFPDFWKSTFERYGGFDDASPVAFPSDLERVLARQKRVLLVAYPGRDFGNVEAFLSAHTTYERIFSTSVRDRWTVYAVTAKAAERAGEFVSTPSIVFAGVVGSGGYSWQEAPSAEPLRRLAGLFAASSAVIVGYQPYRPPWYARFLLGGEQAQRLEPNAEVNAALAHAGVSAVALVCPTSASCDADGAAGERPTVLTPRGPKSALFVRQYDVGAFRVGVFSLGPEAIGDDGGAASLAGVVDEARASVGAEGKLIAIVPAAPDYGRLSTRAEQHVAHRLVDLGVNVVVGLGGYAAKEVEEYGTGVVAYSLGALLRPPTLCLANRDSTGIGLRVSFRSAGSIAYDVVPLTFDDQTRAALGRPATTAQLVRGARGVSGVISRAMTDDLPSATAFTMTQDGAARDLGAWRENPPEGTRFERWYLDRASSLTEWFPVTVANTPLRPSNGAFSSGGAYVARRGALSMGEYRQVIELDPGPSESVGVRFDAVRPGDELEVTYGLADDRLRSKVKALFDQRVTVSLGTREVLSSPMPYRVGWTTVAIDTRSDAGVPAPITIAVHAKGTHFPVSVDAHIVTRR